MPLIKRVYPDAKTAILPLADGGEGTVGALVSGMNGEFRSVRVTDPCGESVTAVYGVITETNTAVIEMSAAAGIVLVPPEKRDPMKTTTYGVGEMIKDAISRGCRDFIIGIGGSATNDGGTGMLQALGFGLLNANGQQIPFGAEGISGLVRNVCSLEEAMNERSAAENLSDTAEQVFRVIKAIGGHQIRQD